MKQIGGPSNFDERKRRTRRRALSLSRLVPPPDDAPPITSDTHPAWMFVDSMITEVDVGTNSIYDLWTGILEKTEFRDRASFESAVEEARRSTKRILTNMRSPMFDFLGSEGEIPNNETGLWELYESAWKRGYAASGTPTDKTKLTDVDKRWLNEKISNLQGSLAHFQQTANNSTEEFAKTVKFLPGGTRRDWRDPVISEERRRMQQALVDGYYDILDEAGDRHGVAWNARGIYGAEKKVYRTPSVQDLLASRPDLENMQALHRTFTKAQIEEWQRENVGLHMRKTAINDYPKQFLKQAAAESYNRAFLRGMAQAGRDQKKTLFVRVSDGEDCGWEEHDDPKKADGLVVGIAEAQRFPLAHPYCRRQFTNTDEPPTKKKKQTQEKAQGKRVKSSPATAAIAGAGVVAAPSMYLASAAIRAAVANLPALLTSLRDDLVMHIPAWRDYQFQLGSAKTILKDELRRPGSDALRLWNELYPRQPLPADLDVLGLNRVRDMVQRNLDEYFEQSQPDITSWTRSALGLDEKKHYYSDEFKERVYDWIDFAEYTRHRDTPLVELLERQLLTEQAQYEYFGSEQMHALRFHLTTPRGVNAGDINKNMALALHEYWKSRQIETLADNVVLQIVEAINPFPVVKADIGKISFRVRISVEGRRKIARKLWLRHKGVLLEKKLDEIVEAETEHRVVSIELERIRKEFGGELPLVTWRDIRDAFLPRVTLNPGGIVSMTAARVNGNVEWAGRILGKGKASFIRLETTARQSTMSRVIRGLREGSITRKEAIEIMKQEAITDFDLFRNSPFATNIKLYGTELQSIAMKLIPRSDLIQLRNRFQLFSWRAPYNWEELTPEQKLAGLKPVRRAEIIKESETAADRGNLSNIVVFPGKVGRLTWHRGLARKQIVTDELGQALRDEAGREIFEILPPQSLTLLRFSYWRNSLLNVARDFRLDVESLREELAIAKSRYSNALRNIKPENVRRVRSWEEVKRYIGDIYEPDPFARFQKVTPGKAEVQVGWFNPQPAARKYRAFVTDADRVQGWMEENFPGMQKIKYIITDTIEPGIFYDDDLGAVLVHPRMASKWNTEHQSLRARTVATNVHPGGTDLPIASLYHEVAHHISKNLSDREYRMLWHEIMETDARWWGDPDAVKWDKIDTVYVQDTIYNYDEVPNKRDVRNIIGRWMGLEKDRAGRWQKKTYDEDFVRSYIRKSTGKKVTISRKAGDVMEDTNRKRIQNNLGEYATAGPDEVIGEALAQYMVSPNPGSIAETVGRVLTNFGYQRAMRATPREVLDIVMESSREIKIYDDVFQGFGIQREMGTVDVLSDVVRDGVEVLTYRTKDTGATFHVFRYQRSKVRIITDPILDEFGDPNVVVPRLNEIVDKVEELEPWLADRGLRIWVGGPDIGLAAGMWNGTNSVLSLAIPTLTKTSTYSDFLKTEPLRNVFKRLGVKVRYTWSSAPEVPGNQALFTLQHELAHVKHYVSMEMLGAVDDPQRYIKRLNDIYAQFELVSTSPSVHDYGGKLVRGRVAAIANEIMTRPDYDGTMRKELMLILDTRVTMHSDELSRILAKAYRNGLIDSMFMNDEGIVPMNTLVRVAKDGMAYSELFGSRGIRFLDADAALVRTGSDYGLTNIHEFIAEVFAGARQGYGPATEVYNELNGLFDDILSEGLQDNRGQRLVSAILGQIPGIKNRVVDLRALDMPEVRKRISEWNVWRGEFNDKIDAFNEAVDSGLNHIEFSTNDDLGRLVVAYSDEDDEVGAFTTFLMQMQKGRTTMQSNFLTDEDFYSYMAKQRPGSTDLTLEAADFWGDMLEIVSAQLEKELPEVAESGFRIILDGDQNGLSPSAYWSVKDGHIGINMGELGRAFQNLGSGLTFDDYDYTGWLFDELNLPRIGVHGGEAGPQRFIEYLIAHESAHVRQDVAQWAASVLPEDQQRQFVQQLHEILVKHELVTYTDDRTLGALLRLFKNLEEYLKDVDVSTLDDETAQIITNVRGRQAHWDDLSNSVLELYKRGHLPSVMFSSRGEIMTMEEIRETMNNAPDDFLLENVANIKSMIRASESQYGYTNFKEMWAESVGAMRLNGSTKYGFGEDFEGWINDVLAAARTHLGPTLYRRLFELVTGTARAT